MATVYRKTYTRPIPAGAAILTHRGRRCARWTDPRGRTKTVPLTEDGTKLLLERSLWYIDYKDAAGRRRTVPGYTDKALSEQKAARLEQDQERVRSGATAVDPGRARMPLADVLETYHAELDRLGRSEVYRANQRRLLGVLARDLGWGTLARVEAGPMTRWLRDAQKAGKSPRTANEYLETAGAFLNWCVRSGYLEHNPLGRIGKADLTERRRVRRALTDDELARLLEAAGPRRLLYLTAMYTGLRRGELRQIQWGDLRLDDPRPHVRLRAATTKNRKAESIPLHPELAAELRAARPAGAGAATPVFPRIPTNKTRRRDYERAGIARLDERGRQSDFHALRLTYCTMLHRQGFRCGRRWR
jgi:integrase